MDKNGITSSVNIHTADWQAEKGELSGIRKKVFIEEQNVPEDMEWDEYDETSIHYIARLDGKVIATARLKSDGQIGRMAVLANYRNKSIGQSLLQFVLQDARKKNIDDIYLHAQVTAIPFYEKQGFVTHGEIFYEADIPHRIMRLPQ